MEKRCLKKSIRSDKPYQTWLLLCFGIHELWKQHAIPPVITFASGETKIVFELRFVKYIDGIILMMGNIDLSTLGILRV